MHSWLLLLALLISSGCAYKYSIPNEVFSTTISGSLESAVLLSEGPMYGSFKGPFGGGESLISVDFDFETLEQSQSSLASDVTLHVAFMNKTTIPSVGHVVLASDGSSTMYYCCNPSLLSQGYCDEPRSLILDNGTEHAPAFASFDITEGEVDDSVTYNVPEEGIQWVLLVVCSDDENVQYELDVDLAFKNPHGYLPGQSYGYLPFYLALSIAYLVFAIGYTYSFIRQRKYIIALQRFVLSVIYIGFFEMIAYFGTYYSKNQSGIPTPCDICETTGDYLFAIVLGVFKRAFSRMLLLAVCLGYGVVRAKLSKQNIAIISFLGLAYLICGIFNEMEQETNFRKGSAMWEILLFPIDLAFIVFIVTNLNKIRQELADQEQQNKLRMYEKLLNIIVANVAVYAIFLGSLIFIRTGESLIPWKWTAFVSRFYDIIYLCVLGAIASIWAPGPTASQYAYYSQPTMTDEFDEDERSEMSEEKVEDNLDQVQIEIEMPEKRRQSVSEGAKGKVPDIGTFVISADSDDEASNANEDDHDYLEEHDKARLRAEKTAKSDKIDSRNIPK